MTVAPPERKSKRTPSRALDLKFERLLQCVECSRKEVVCEPQGQHVDADTFRCASCLHARVKLEYGDLPWAY